MEYVRQFSIVGGTIISFSKLWHIQVFMYLDSTVQVFVLENWSHDKPLDLFFHCFYKAIRFLRSINKILFRIRHGIWYKVVAFGVLLNIQELWYKEQFLN